ncbi:hybrid sensor histidine kinase/response regulator transcription factor [Pedobacter sp. SYSU D00535]|uniref:hybrid sensor histidine kinase/response regulator transcription factor n=1 Tax=Pedobacter sp. SYSU D00535 TaxID=2810308 RepID=UPI001A9798B8|nr:hybrid sensor histidine kinase/response regulator transcription factor [Pedobacter sp. SYSU D00535]
MPVERNRFHKLVFALSLTIQLLVLGPDVYGQRQRLRFQHITTESGLSNNTVQTICQDRLGFLWFGTRDGLNRYDGKNISIYRNEIGNRSSISENLINKVFEDRGGNLWIGTAEGIDRFAPETETFEHYNPDRTPTEVRDIIEDKTGQLWIGTNKGLYRFDKRTRKFSRWSNRLNSIRINRLLEDNLGFLWLGTEIGLYRIEPKSGKLTSFPVRPGDPESLQSRVIHELFQDGKGRVWVGMSEGGLALYNGRKASFTTYKADPGFASNPQTTNSLPHNDIRSITEVEPGMLWIGTENGGLCVFDTRRGSFTTYQPNIADPASLSHDSIHSLLKDQQGNVWVGTWAGGVNYYSASLLKFPLYNKFPQAEFPGVESVARDQDGLMWLGVVENGLYSYNPQNNKFTYYPNPNIERFEVGIYSIKELNKDTLVLATRRGGMAFFDKKKHTFTHFLPREGRNSIGGHELNTVLVDQNKDIWSGGWNTGVSRFSHRTKTFTNYKHNPTKPGSPASDLIYTIFEDRAGRIWIGTGGGGLDLYSPKTNSFVHFRHEKDNLNTLSHNTVISIYEDRRGRFWVGTSNGLNLMDRQRRTFKVFTQKDGLPNDVINSIVEDNEGNLWLGTNKGICCFNPDSKTVRSFTPKDGLQGNEFLMNAAARDNAGKLYFSGYKGLNIFHPRHIRYNRAIPPVFITSFSIGNKPVPIGAEGSPLSRHISQTKEIRLSYDQSVFSFNFAALNYISPEENKYAYKMEGFEKDWNYVGNKHTATYTNLDPGNYTFRVIASNNDGFWNKKGTAVTLIISPPFWETWWFRVVVLILVLAAAYRAYRFKRTLELEELEKAKREEIHQTQLLFFTNISHEFRTPLSLILGPLEKLLQENTSPAIGQYLRTMHRNTLRLMNLINELMDFRKVEAGALKLKVMQGNISLFLDEIADEFRDSAADKKIQFEVIKEEIPEEIWFDRHVVEKIILNLINNSLKYTPEGGRITLQLFTDLRSFSPSFTNRLNIPNSYAGKRYIHLRVADNGIGISKDSINHLFERYYRITDTHLGSGVGLAFVKSLATLHKGSILVSSEKNEGTEIVISLPCGNDDYSEDERWIQNEHEAGTRLESVISLPEDPEEPGSWDQDSGNQQKHILLVDDNEELRSFLKGTLGAVYKISEAANGMAGIEKAKETFPDLIISDVMMPGMNGIEFCRRVKEDIEICHIPFLMLTAKNSTEAEIEGVESGSDYYFTKPVSIQLLQLTIKNIFAQRQKIRDHYTQDHHAEVRELAHSTKDKEFIDKLLKIIESQLVNPDLDIDFLCREIGMSRTKLYQKIKSITGQSTGEFVRTIRLRKALEIMTHDDVLLTEVMYRVGIQTQSYFTKAFKKEFGKTPSQFLQDLKKA